jgi:hypothetical protein
MEWNSPRVPCKRPLHFCMAPQGTTYLIGKGTAADGNWPKMVLCGATGARNDNASRPLQTIEQVTRDFLANHGKIIERVLPTRPSRIVP